MQLQQWKYGQKNTVLHTSKQEQVKPTISQAPGQTARPRGPLCANFEKTSHFLRLDFFTISKTRKTSPSCVDRTVCVVWKRKQARNL